MEPKHPLPCLASLSLARELHNGTQPSPKGLWATQSSPWKLTDNSGTAFGLRRPRLRSEHPCREKCALSSVSEPAPLDLTGGRSWRGFYLLMNILRFGSLWLPRGTGRTHTIQKCHLHNPSAPLTFLQPWGFTNTSGRVFQLLGLAFYFPKWVLLLFCPTPSSDPLKLFGICYSQFWKNRFLCCRTCHGFGVLPHIPKRYFSNTYKHRSLFK